MVLLLPITAFFFWASGCFVKRGHASLDPHRVGLIYLDSRHVVYHDSQGPFEKHAGN